MMKNQIEMVCILLNMAVTHCQADKESKAFYVLTNSSLYELCRLLLILEQSD